MDYLITALEGESESVFTKLVEKTTALPEMRELNEILHDESSQLTTVIIFVISAVFVIILIFLGAIFIDYRQEKLQNLETQERIRTRRRKILKILPKVHLLNKIKEDETSIIDKIQTEYAVTSSEVV